MMADQSVVKNYISHYIAEYQKEQNEKEILFEKAMNGQYDLDTPYVEDLDLILKHDRNRRENN